MKKKMNKGICLLLATTMLTVGVTGCGFGASDMEENKNSVSDDTDVAEYAQKSTDETSQDTENTDKETFSFFEFKNSKDRTIQHVKLWKEVQYFVNKHIKSDYTTDYFDIRPNNNVNSYKSLITFDNALKIRSLQI